MMGGDKSTDTTSVTSNHLADVNKGAAQNNIATQPPTTNNLPQATNGAAYQQRTRFTSQGITYEAKTDDGSLTIYTGFGPRGFDSLGHHFPCRLALRNPNTLAIEQRFGLTIAIGHTHPSFRHIKDSEPEEMPTDFVDYFTKFQAYSPSNQPNKNELETKIGRASLWKQADNSLVLHLTITDEAQFTLTKTEISFIRYLVELHCVTKGLPLMIHGKAGMHRSVALALMLKGLFDENIKKLFQKNDSQAKVKPDVSQLIATLKPEITIHTTASQEIGHSQFKSLVHSVIASEILKDIKKEIESLIEPGFKEIYLQILEFLYQCKSKHNINLDRIFCNLNACAKLSHIIDMLDHTLSEDNSLFTTYGFRENFTKFRSCAMSYTHPNPSPDESAPVTISQKNANNSVAVTSKLSGSPHLLFRDVASIKEDYMPENNSGPQQPVGGNPVVTTNSGKTNQNIDSKQDSKLFDGWTLIGNSGSISSNAATSGQRRP